VSALLPTDNALSNEAFHTIMHDKYRGIDVTATESANALKRMHILSARAVGSVGAPHWAQEMQLALVNLSNNMQQGFLHVNQRLDHIEEIVRSLKVGMSCL
jgi:hypothetical protein